MKLSELLEHVGSVYLDDRTQLESGDPDSLWSDAMIVRYLNEAQRILARRAWCIIEYGVAPAGIITLATDKVLYPLHKSVLRVFDATPSTQDAPLGRTEDILLRDPTPPGSDAFDQGEAASLQGIDTTTTGATVAFATDAGTRMLRVYPTPSSTENGVVVSLKVARMPINWLNATKPEESPEVPEETHLAMCDYAAARCLLMPNEDGFKPEGRELLKDFYRQVLEARQDRQRAERGSDRWAFSSTTRVIR